VGFLGVHAGIFSHKEPQNLFMRYTTKGKETLTMCQQPLALAGENPFRP